MLAERGEEPMAMPAMAAMPAMPAMPAAAAALGDEGDGRASLSAAAPPPSEKSLEEIQEMHLRDSFWTVP